jgi:hypothetical protein
MSQITRIGFTGTRDGMSKPQLREVERLLILFGPQLCELHHGDCVGADEQAHDLALKLELSSIVIHPPEKKAMRSFCIDKKIPDGSRTSVVQVPAKDYFARNRDIVQASDVLIGTPHPLASPGRGGTWYTISHAQKIWEGRNPIYIVLHDGSVQRG